jgi:propionyl-CoA synthetase
VNNKVRGDVGAFARLFGVIIVNRLPKTRSGKIVRGTMKKMVNKWEWKMPATIDDPTTLDEIREGFEKFMATVKPE